MITSLTEGISPECFPGTLLYNGDTNTVFKDDVPNSIDDDGVEIPPPSDYTF